MNFKHLLNILHCIYKRYYFLFCTADEIALLFIFLTVKGFQNFHAVVGTLNNYIFCEMFCAMVKWSNLFNIVDIYITDCQSSAHVYSATKRLCDIEYLN